MCGRFSLGIPSERFMEFFNIASIKEREDYFRYNVAPSQIIPGILQNQSTGNREVNWFRWGLIPYWADDPKIGYKMINARGETVQQKPSFRQAFKSRRLLIPAQGFYEWDHREKERIPWFIRRRDGNPMAFAGLWEHWKHNSDEIISCTIITTDADDAIKPLHDRMPVILDTPAWDVWFDPEAKPDTLQSLLVPAPSEEIERYRVSSAVNSAKHEGEDCITPITKH